MSTKLGNAGVTFPDGSIQTSSSRSSIQYFFNPSNTFTVPANVTSVKVTVIAAGAGGNSTNGGGGGGGASIKTITGLTSGTTISVTVGVGGTTGNAGGSSSFGTYCSATGGSTGSGGVGAGGTGSNGDLNIDGGDGNFGYSYVLVQGGGSSLSAPSSNVGKFPGGGGGYSYAGASGVVIVEY